MEKVVIAMSGGVDSSVAAYLLKESGYNVIGVTMKIWQSQDPHVLAEKGGCCGLTAAEDARFVCNQLGIPHYVLNFSDIFRKTVMDYFADQYISGNTPNPCIACNRYVKWQALLDKTLQLEANYMATGHYASIVRHPQTNRLTIKAADNKKDQSYALYNLTQSQLAATIFPISNMQKDDLRELAAKKLGLRVAHKPDSQEICFIPDQNHPKFLEEHLGMPLVQGDFVDTAGNALGRHKGIGHYTIGQRKGLGMAFGVPMYVKCIDAANAKVVLSDNKSLFSNEMVVDDINFMSLESINGDLKCFGKIRYSHNKAPVTISQKDNKLMCSFETAQRAITPGQAAVFYDEENRIICGGTIVS